MILSLLRSKPHIYFHNDVSRLTTAINILHMVRRKWDGFCALNVSERSLRPASTLVERITVRRVTAERLHRAIQWQLPTRCAGHACVSHTQRGARINRETAHRTTTRKCGVLRTSFLTGLTSFAVVKRLGLRRNDDSLWKESALMSIFAGNNEQETWGLPQGLTPAKFRLKKRTGDL